MCRRSKLVYLCWGKCIGQGDVLCKGNACICSAVQTLSKDDDVLGGRKDYCTISGREGRWQEGQGVCMYLLQKNYH